ncbi:MAG: hypothetical protein H6719_12285 [Sandaracinaceae bacterium]|nr:hypothetical protein [Sandaracinaceae bacterium]
MGSLPFVLQVVLPRSGAVPTNSAIVLQGHVQGALSVSARAAGVDVDVTLEAAPELGPRAPGTYRMWLVRPAAGVWPSGGTVVLTATREPQEPAVLEVPIASAPDLTPPVLSSISPPETMVFGGPREPSREVVVLLHRGLVDEASPLVIVTLEAGGSILTGSVLEGMAGALPMPPGGATALDAITLADLAGNAVRITNPCTETPASEPPAPEAPAPAPPPAPFTCIAGAIMAEGDEWFATTDAGTENGFSRGHYRANESVAGDLEISFTATRLSDDHGMPIEVAFRGGFFAATGTSSCFLYESDANWTGWQSTPTPTGPGPLTLRVVQRGAEVSGFVDGVLAGSLTLRSPTSEGPVGVFFKGPPGKRALMRFRDFAVRSLAPPAPSSRPVGRLVWGGYDVGVGDAHPAGAANPSGEPWDFAVLATEDEDTILARVWLATIESRVVADFEFDDALDGQVDEAVLPLLVEGFFGDEGHTLGYYRNPDRFDQARLTNLRTGSSWWFSWESIDEQVQEMKASPAFVPRDMR